MKKALTHYPLYVFLLPLFFVLHGCLEYFGYIPPADAWLLAGIYCLAAGIVYLVFLLLFKQPVKAALAAVFFLACYFFFGALQDFFKEHWPILHKYSVLLPLMVVLGIALLVALKKRPAPPVRLHFFLNCLLIIYMIVDGSGWLIKSLRSGAGNKKGVSSSAGAISFRPIAGLKKPDIYFLVFDAYTSSAALREKFHFDNSGLDSFLTGQGFHIQAASRSNYKYTILAMPSILNMSYNNGLKDVKGGPVAEIEYLSDLIKENELTSFLHSQGYVIVNASIFDLHGYPSPIGESLLPLKTRLITSQTLYSRFSRDISWMFLQYIRDPFSESAIDGSLHNDEKLIGLLRNASAAKTPFPRFFYGHFNMPHPPYYYDRSGVRKKVGHSYISSDEDQLSDYLDYLPHTNEVVKDLVTTIKKNTDGQAVIVIMGDHGLRFHDSLGYNPLFFVQNQNAVYFPSGDYRQLYDSISGVNQFRVILNTLFAQNIPLLKDSIVNVKDKK